MAANLAQAGCLGWKWSCHIGWRYNGAKLYLSWPYMVVSMIWNTYKLSASQLSHATAIFLLMAANLALAGFLGWKWSLWPVPARLAVYWRISVFSWPYMIVSMIWNTSELFALHFSHATASFFDNCCQFGPNWMFGMKMELMACADLVGGTTEQSCLFPVLKF